MRAGCAQMALPLERGDLRAGGTDRFRVCCQQDLGQLARLRLSLQPGRRPSPWHPSYVTVTSPDGAPEQFGPEPFGLRLIARTWAGWPGCASAYSRAGGPPPGAPPTSQSPAPTVSLNPLSLIPLASG